MKRTQRSLWLAAAIGCLAFSTAMGGQKWVAIGEFQAGGDGKLAPFSGTVSACRIVCTEGSIIVNTFIVLEGNKRTPISVGVRIPAGQMHEITLPNGPRTVTGFRVSDNARGKYRLEVLKQGAGKGGDAAAAPDNAKKKAKKNQDNSESQPADTPVEEAAPVSQTPPVAPVLLPAPAGLPQPVETETPPVQVPVVPVKAPIVPATPPTPTPPAGGTTDGGNAPLPWEVK